MSFEALLINTCIVLEDTGAGPDDYGGEIPNWTAVAGLSDISCRLVAGSGREVVIGAEVVIADYKLFVGDITITEQNRIRMGGIDYEILLVMDRQDGIDSHHKECYLRTVR
ncbi:unnamed protein product [marine sediment metagenome]|uniref:Phage head-tail adaptor n=1 Tax=marine sediment metagenome TaxID=412755 RepID=X1ALM8_9ZZZZ